jgi:hypothetical protein
MATRRAPAEDQVTDFVAEVAGVASPVNVEQWDERSTRITLARPIMRHHRIIGPGHKCLDCCFADEGRGERQLRHRAERGRCLTCEVPDAQCAARTHHFHVQASQSRDGSRWLGPEADHVLQLIAAGVVEGTRAKLDRDRRQTATEVGRNVHGELVTDPDGNVVMRPMPELAEPSTEDVTRTWERTLAGGPAEVRRRERQEARRADEGDGNAVLTLARAMRLAQSGAALDDPEAVEAVWAGAQAPGTQAPPEAVD